MNEISNHHEAEQQNRALWDEIAPIHLKAYNEVALLREGCEVLDEIELREVGDVDGKSLLHLQCHIGSDTLAWARHGAVVTGVDFSAESIACANQLSEELRLPGTFIHSNIYDVRAVHEGQYDIVYTSKGVLCWLKDLQEWGRIIAHYLKPSGVFYLMESHPIIMALEETESGELSFAYPYFHKDAPTEWAPGDPDYAGGLRNDDGFRPIPARFHRTGRRRGGHALATWRDHPGESSARSRSTGQSEVLHRLARPRRPLDAHRRMPSSLRSPVELRLGEKSCCLAENLVRSS